MSGTYTLDVFAGNGLVRTITRVATDHPDGWQSVAYQGARYQLYERRPGQFWIDLMDQGKARDLR